MTMTSTVVVVVVVVMPTVLQPSFVVSFHKHFAVIHSGLIHTNLFYSNCKCLRII